MAYTAPTVDEITARFPQFEDVDDEILASLIVEANRDVDDSWTEADYKPAIMYLVAHMATVEGLANEDGGAAAVSAPGPVKSESLGDASVTYGERVPGATGSDADLATTVYGQRFLSLRKANVGGPLIV